jgi:hypothetical protein
MNEFKYTPPKNTPVTDEELLNDLKKVAKILDTEVLTMKMYSEHGQYDVTNLSRRFGTWNEALKKANFKGGNINNYSDEELFENILQVWQHKGKQPTRRDLATAPSKISQGPYNRRFDSWSHALQSFIEYTSPIYIQSIFHSTNEIQKDKETNRDPSLRLRFKVLKRDNFTCKQCGASPAKNTSVELHIDHIVPWSKGGETIIENLQTLCQKCNLGKSNLE